MERGLDQTRPDWTDLSAHGRFQSYRPYRGGIGPGLELSCVA